VLLEQYVDARVDPLRHQEVVRVPRIREQQIVAAEARADVR